ncbi:MAG: nucleotide sugar dehydrogenase [Candidatus Pacebacteria bacterium]|nr:nucleotide sugar dehydrogenase [Candidatus Paceibacterota bacterium]
MAGNARECIGVVGLGYVGLPLAVAFGLSHRVIGFDINAERVSELAAGRDVTNEADPGKFMAADIVYTADPEDLKQCNVIVVAVPTPVDKEKHPDITALAAASQTVGRILQKGMLVVYESTVYPGVTEECCLAILEQESGLALGDFDLGYSPERINPGDKQHTLENVIKVVSGHDARACERVASVYSRVVKAGVHKAPTIKTAEAAKVIENIQRDLNIALMNELSKIFARAGINTDEVLAAAGTKWNFHPYRPGLVGGHCIGVDPYYMTHLATKLDMHPRVILAGRETNDSMGRYVGGMVVRELSRLGKRLLGARVLLMGLTFKEDVPDCRNSRAVDVVNYLKEFGAEVFGCEPLLPRETVAEAFGAIPVDVTDLPKVDAVVIINKHRKFQSMELRDVSLLSDPPLLFDLKNMFDRYAARAAGIRYFSL